MTAFSLLDPQIRFDALAWEGLRPFPEGGFEAADEDEDVDARHLCRRVKSLKAALDDIDAHAKRFARWQARQARLPVRIRRVSPIRRFYPPGHVRRLVFSVDLILSDCHDLAWRALMPDTS